MNDVIADKLKTYGCETSEDLENALKEITQEVVLYALSNTDFFEKASFQGGTCLRVVHHLDRFSEDLDFVLNEPNPDFELAPYLDVVVNIMEVYGYRIEISGKDKANNNIKTRFLKDDSILKIVNLEHYSNTRKKIRIKLELDTNPPFGAKEETKYLDFPIDYSILTQNLPSLLAGKCHALLCRNFVKGRDWYDYCWYVAKGTTLNFNLLEHAIDQHGPWKNQNISLTHEWLKEKLIKKIYSLHWEDVKKDVSRFLKPEKQKTLDLWNKEFFRQKTEKFIHNQETSTKQE